MTPLRPTLPSALADARGSSPRRIVNLLRATLIPRPASLPPQTAKKGSPRATGLAFERKMEARLRERWPALTYHQWIEWADAFGTHVCEPDAYLVLPDRVVLFEMKLTASAYGVSQMADLYAPLLSHIYGGRPVTSVLVAKSLAPGVPGPFIDTLDEVLALPAPGYACLVQPR